MKVIIAGSRNMQPSDAWLIPEAVKRSGFDITEVVCGVAKGADSLGAFWAAEHKIPVKMFPAQWSVYGRAAGPIRNKEMLDYADGLIVFIWNNSKGSANMLAQTKKANKPYFVVHDGKL